MEGNPRTARAYAIAAAAAHDLNNELTVILNSLSNSMLELEPDHPACRHLLDLQGAAQRCAWTAAALLNFSARHGAPPTAATCAALMDQ